MPILIDQHHIPRHGDGQAAAPSTYPVTVDGKFFRCGTTRFDLRGVTYGTFEPRASDGQRYPEAPRLRADLAAMTAAGFTVVRTYVEPRGEVLDSIAESGLRVMAGCFWPDWRYLVGSGRRQQRAMARDARRTLRDAAERMRGRPEVLALCLANEVPADVIRWVGTDGVAALIDELADEVRSVDPDRLVTYANYPSTEYLPLDSLDFLTFNVFLERKADLRRYLTRLQTLAGDRPLVLGELGLDAAGGTAAGEAAQAHALAWQLDTALERGVAGTCVFSWTDDWWVGDERVSGWHFGLTRADRSPRPALEVAASRNQRVVSSLMPDAAWPSMTVVVCAYNAEATLDECLEHTCRLDYPNLEILVVDDGSTDRTAEIAERHPAATLVRIPHAGLSAARNVGLHAAQGDIVAYLDADAYPGPEWPYYLALGFDSRTVGGVGGPNVPPPSDAAAAALVAAAPGGPVHVLVADDRAEHVPGCNMAFWRDVLLEVGGFEPVYTAAGDDVDVCWKVLDKGWEIGFHPAAQVWHHRRSSTRAYLRQQRGYGRAEALVSARHPDRFNSIGSARWRGRIYGGGSHSIGRQRIYRGTYGAAAFQSVYRSGGTVGEVLHQVGLPAAAVLLASAPLSLVVGGWWVVPLFAVTFVLGIGAIDAEGAVVPRTRTSRRTRFRLGVAALSLLQPLARTLGRLEAMRSARRDLPPPPRIVGPAQRIGGGVLVLPSAGERAAVTRAVIDVVRRAGITVTTPTGWERRDVGMTVSRLVAADLLTTGHVEGVVQVVFRPRVRIARCGLGLAIIAALLVVRPNPMLAIATSAWMLADVCFGVRRARVGLPKLLERTAGRQG